MVVVLALGSLAITTLIVAVLEGDLVGIDDASAVYLVAVECHLCGHVLFFNSERFSTGDGPLIEREAPKSGA